MMAEGFDEEEVYWRDKAVRNRLGFALEHDKVFTDITFLVGKNEERILAHKLILRLSSLVFENLISNHEEQGLDEIKLPNMRPSMFKRLLKFIYTDELEMHDFLHFIRVAKDFGFHRLAEQSQKVLKNTNVTSENAVFLLDIAKGFMDSDLEQTALEFIKKNAENVLNSRTFVQVSYRGLCQIFMDDELLVDEFAVFTAAVRWATVRCKNNTIAVSGENIRNILKRARLLIRYKLITYDQLISSVKESEILTDSEYLLILKSYVDPSDNPLGIPTKPRGPRYDQDKFVALALEGQNNVTPRHPAQGTSHDGMIQAQLLVEFPLEEHTLDNALPVLTHSAEDISHGMMQEKTFLEKVEAQLIQLEIPQSSFHAPALISDVKDEDIFECRNCSIDFQDILDMVEIQFAVKKIVLHNVNILNPAASAGRRVFMPNLESFIFVQDKDLSATLPDKSFMDGLTSKDLLFFEKSRNELWNFSNLCSLGVEISIYVKGIRFMELDPKAQKLVLAYPIQGEADLIFRTFTRQYSLKSLCVTACQMVGEDHISTRLMETLVLQGVTFLTEGKAKTFINKCRFLQKLSIFLTTGMKINFETDLTRTKLTLKILALAKVDIGVWNEKKHVEPFISLEELYLDVCTWEKPFELRAFNVLFPNLKRLVIRSKDDCRPTVCILQAALDIPSLERVAIFRYPGCQDTSMNPNLNLFVPPCTPLKTTMISFLTAAGLQFPNNEVPNFILLKDFSSGLWKAMVDLSELDEIHFHQSLLNEFFIDSAVSKLIAAV